MLRSLWLSMVYAVFLCGGLVAPFVVGLGYVWIDTFTPQKIAYSILTEIPVSLIMAVAAVSAYLLFDRRNPPRPTLIMILILLMGAWVTFTTIECAVAPEFAWPKWNWAIKTIGFAAFMPFMFRSRVQIESFLQVYVFSSAIQIVPYGAKTLLGGGSYHANLGLLAGNSGLAEGSTLATVAIMSVPIVLWLRRHTLILGSRKTGGHKLAGLIYLGMAAAACLASVGTIERTGLIAMVVMFFGLWLRSRHKLRYAGLAAAALAVLLVYVVQPNSRWAERMATMAHYSQDTSAYGRILVWKWTLDFVQSHPFGGGFNAYVMSIITFPAEDGQVPVVVHGRAFHNMYFEMLGEHGWVGLGLFVALLAAAAMTLLRVARICRTIPDLEWCRDLAFALLTSEAVVAVAGCFIGIAFQPEVYYLFALATMLACHVRIVQRAAQPEIAAFPQSEPEIFGTPSYG